MDLRAGKVGGAVGVLARPRQEPQRFRRGAGEALDDPGLLSTDRLDQGAVGEREAPAHPGSLVVVVDEDCPFVLVFFEAAEVQARNLTDAAPGPLQELVDEDGHLPGPFPKHAEAP